MVSGDPPPPSGIHFGWSMEEQIGSIKELSALYLNKGYTGDLRLERGLTIKKVKNH